MIGAGPAGLETALTLARRGLEVTLADQGAAPGGRLVREATLPGLQTWIRVRDWRVHMLGKLPNAQLFPGSRMAVDDVRAFGADHVVLATGAHWRRDGVGVLGMAHGDFPKTLTPDDVFAGAVVTGPVIIYDDEHYFMGGALAERLARAGHEVALVSPEASVSSWTAYTDEQGFVQARLLELGVRLHLSRLLTGQAGDTVRLACAYTGRESEVACGTLILVTGRVPDDRLYSALTESGVTAARVGDCLQPSTIADAVYSGHRFARLFGTKDADLPPRRERPTPR